MMPAATGRERPSSERAARASSCGVRAASSSVSPSGPGTPPSPSRTSKTIFESVLMDSSRMRPRFTLPLLSLLPGSKLRASTPVGGFRNRETLCALPEAALARLDQRGLRHGEEAVEENRGYDDRALHRERGRFGNPPFRIADSLASVETGCSEPV